METLPQETEENRGHKILVGFKCSPALRMTLCEQAERIGVSLSSHVEAIVSTYTEKDTRIKELSAQVSRLQAIIDFYETPFLHELYEKFKGQSITYYDREGNQMTIIINSIADVFIVLISSFKIDR